MRLFKDGIKGFLDRVSVWLAVHVLGYSSTVLQVTATASVRMDRPHKLVKSYGTSAYSFYRVRADEIGFTGSKEMYKIVKEAIERTGLRYRLRYFGTRITPR